jgi:hypothetical protein
MRREELEAMARDLDLVMAVRTGGGVRTYKFARVADQPAPDPLYYAVERPLTVQKGRGKAEAWLAGYAAGVGR